MFYHAWADEWNVNYWAFGADVASLIEGNSTLVDTYGEMYPDDGEGDGDGDDAGDEG